MRVIYSVVRFVPDPARAEAINVAAIAGSDESSEWQLRQVENPVRARAIDERGTLDAVWSFLDGIGRQIDRHERSLEMLWQPEEPLSEEWLEDLFVEHRNIVQLTPPAPMVAESVEEALEQVFDELVLDPAQRRFSFRKKHVALAAVRAAYRRNAIMKGHNLQERVILKSSAYDTGFDFAVTNGKVLQLTQTWSFQVPDQAALAEQVMAWGWTMADVRRDGGRVVASEGRQLWVPSDVDVEVVYVPPSDHDHAPALREAVNVFKRLDVVSTPLPEADKVGVRARELLTRAGARPASLSDYP
jgi:hypothetical protein